MSIRSVPTQPYMGPSALQIAPGGAQRAGPTQVSPGTTTKWNGGVQFDQSFPKPISAVKESFQPEEAEESDEGSDCCSGYSCRWISDHPAKLFLLFMALGVFVLTIVALISGLNTLSSNAFFYYSKFAWEQWFPSFFVIMVMLMLLTLVAMAVICFAVFLSWVERRSLIRAFYISSLSLGVIMLSLALFCWLYGNRAKPYVIRAGNLLCQDPKIWHCSGSSARRLDELNETEDSEWPRFHPLQEEMFHPGFHFSLGDLPSSVAAGRRLAASLRSGAPGRRLNPAAASLAFVKSLNSAVDPRTNEPEGCKVVMEICQPPANFNMQTACVCSGNWDYAPIGTSTPAPATGLPGDAEPTASPAAPAPTNQPAVLPNFEGTTAEPVNPYAGTATVVTVQPQAESTAAASTTAPATAASTSSAAPAAGRRLREDIGPWLGSLGAFCGKWGNDDYVKGEWCFVLPSQQCSPNERSQYVSTRGYPMIRSTAPCGGEVDSRSALLLVGHDQMMEQLKYTALLGGALLALAGAGYMLFLYPSRDTKYEALQSEPARAPQQRGGSPYAQRGPGAAGFAPEAPEQKSNFNLQRFQEAQAQAVNKLTRSTPEDLRLQIYAYYKQATEGDVQGERPAYFQQKERAKYDAWVKCRGMSFDTAVDKYCEVVQRI